MLVKEAISEKQLISGKFTPEQSVSLVNGMLNESINQLKVNALSNWINDHAYNDQNSNESIQALEYRKTELMALLKTAKEQGKQVQLNFNIEIALES